MTCNSMAASLAQVAYVQTPCLLLITGRIEAARQSGEGVGMVGTGSSAPTTSAKVPQLT